MTATNALTADAVKAIADLVKRDHVSVSFEPLPAEALGLGVNVEKPHVAIIRQGDKVEILSIANHVEAARGKPFQRVGTAHVSTLASLIDLAVRHKRDNSSVIFANSDWKEPSITAVLDYHVATTGPREADAEAFEDDGARFGKHRIHYAYPLSDSWQEWVAANGRKMNQADFAAFLEEHITELASPTDAERNLWEEAYKAKFATPSELLDLSRGLEVMSGHKVKNRVRLQTGEVQMVFEVEHKDAEGNELTVPGLFLLSLPPFRRGDPIRIPVRLRFRAAGEVVWFFEMVEPARFIEERIDDDLTTVANDTGLPVFEGAPEAVTV
jgi:uncharacterized protein YfdQ (DUF2303 family)